MMDYYNHAGHLQQRIIELGEKGELTYGDILALYGSESKAKKELKKILTMGIAKIDCETEEVQEDTEIDWAFQAREMNYV